MDLPAMYGSPQEMVSDMSIDVGAVAMRADRRSGPDGLIGRR